MRRGGSRVADVLAVLGQIITVYPARRKHTTRTRMLCNQILTFTSKHTLDSAFVAPSCSC
jgi:hypothetical protein